MADYSGGNPEQAMRLFFSLDLAGASKYKYGHPPSAISDGDRYSWPSFFIEFFKTAGRTFWQNIRRSGEEHQHGLLPFEFWKTLGDEILFHSTQTSEEQPYWQLRSFIQTVQSLHSRVQSDTNLQLGVKGVVWSAGFPIRNKRIFLDPSNGTSVYEGDEETLVQQTGASATPGAVMDFMGLEMDQGFRLGSFATPGRVLISPDAAYLAAIGFMKIDANRPPRSVGRVGIDGLVEDSPEFRVFQVGWEPLRGVLGDLPVPLLWPECVRADPSLPNRQRPPFTFDPARSRSWKQYLESPAMGARELRDFFESWNDDLRRHGVEHIRPYVLANSSMDKGHAKAWRNAGAEGLHPGPTVINLRDNKS